MKKKKQKDEPADVEISTLLTNAGFKGHLCGLMVFDSGIYTSENIWKRPFRSSHYSIIMVHRGNLSIKVNLSQYVLKESQMMIIPPFAIREMDWERDHVHFSSLLFRSDFLTSSIQHAKSLSLFRSFSRQYDLQSMLDFENYNILSRIFELIRLLLWQDNPASKADDILVHTVFKSAILQVNKICSSTQQASTYDNSIVRHFFELLHQHYKKQREVRYYASRLNVHEKYLSQVLKEHTGTTARSYITEMVLLEAKVLLDNPQLTISNIADHLDFSNQFHFSRFFKRYTGVTPSHYRNNPS